MARTIASVMPIYVVPLAPDGSDLAAAGAVQGNVASGATDSGNPVKVGGKYNSTLPTFADGQRGDVQLGTRGSVHVELWGTDSATPIAAYGISTGDGGTQTAALVTIGFPRLFNGTDYDRWRSGGATGAALTQFGKPTTNPFTRTTLNISTATTTSIVSGTASQTARIYRMHLNIAASQTIDLQSSGGASLWGGAHTFSAGAVLIWDFMGEAWAISTVAEGLQLVTTTTGVVRGFVDYIKSA